MSRQMERWKADDAEGYIAEEGPDVAQSETGKGVVYGLHVRGGSWTPICEVESYEHAVATLAGARHGTGLTLWFPPDAAVRLDHWAALRVLRKPDPNDLRPGQIKPGHWL